MPPPPPLGFTLLHTCCPPSHSQNSTSPPLAKISRNTYNRNCISKENRLLPCLCKLYYQVTFSVSEKQAPYVDYTNLLLCWLKTDTEYFVVRCYHMRPSVLTNWWTVTIPHPRTRQDLHPCLTSHSLLHIIWYTFLG